VKQRPVSFLRTLSFGVIALAVMIGCNAVLGNEEGTPRIVLADRGDAATVTTGAVIGDGGSLDRCDTSQGDKVCFGVCVKTNQTSTGCGDPSCVACDPKNAKASQCQGEATGFTCGYDACKAGYLDCDGNLSNGCETPVGADHCGDCGTSCSNTQKPFCGPDPAHAGAFACLGSCPPTTTACQGACVDTTTSTENCGGCGKLCDQVGFTASCVASKCVFTCPNGTHACGAKCVSAIDTSACGPNCLPCPSDPAIHVLATCNTEGTCGTICETGYHDCDGNSTNGCETQGICPVGTSSGTSGCVCGTSGGAASIQPLAASTGGICVCPVSVPE
jgi:hypothetical protein